MALIKSDSGCKVGWETYDNEDEAKARAEAIKPERARMLRQGYDFGYQWPGTVDQHREYTTQREDGSPNASGPYVLIDLWTVTVP